MYAPNVNKLFVFGGDSPTSGIVVNTTRIYDIATNTWSTGAPMPDVRAFMASGYFQRQDLPGWWIYHRQRQIRPLDRYGSTTRSPTPLTPRGRACRPRWAGPGSG